MKPISELFADPQKTLKDITKHPRFKLLDEIGWLVNKDREAAGYSKLAPRILAVKMGHLSVQDMDYLLKQMRLSRTPGRVFFGFLKLKPKKPVEAP